MLYVIYTTYYYIFRYKATPRRRWGWTPDAESGKITGGTAGDSGGFAAAPAR
jgi:hypothetical protein